MDTTRVTIDWPTYAEGEGADGDDVETVYKITCAISPGDPGCHTMANGDPGWPSTGPEVEILKIEHLGKTIPTTEWDELGINRDMEGIMDAALEAAPGPVDDDPPDSRD